MKFFQSITQVIVVRVFYRIKTAEYHRSSFAITGECFRSRIIRISNGVTNASVFYIFNGSSKETYLANFQRIYVNKTGFKITNFSYIKLCTSRHHANLHTFFNAAVDNTHIKHYTFVCVKLGVKHQCFKRFFRVTVGSRYFRYDCFQHIFNTNTSFRTAKYSVRSINTNYIFYFFFNMVRVSTGKVNFIYNRNNFQIVVQRQVNVSQSLCFNTLGRVNYQERTFARSQSTGNFVGKVYVTGGIDKVEHILFAIASFINAANSLRFNSNTTFTFQIHGVKDLFFHLTFRESASVFNQSVS